MALPYMAPLVYLFICLNSITVYHVLWALAWNKVFIYIYLFNYTKLAFNSLKMIQNDTVYQPIKQRILSCTPSGQWHMVRIATTAWLMDTSPQDQLSTQSITGTRGRQWEVWNHTLSANCFHQLLPIHILPLLPPYSPRQTRPKFFEAAHPCIWNGAYENLDRSRFSDLDRKSERQLSRLIKNS